MEEFIIYIITFILVYLFYYIFIIRKDSKKHHLTNSVEFRYLKSVYKINEKNVDKKKVSRLIALSNSFIISTVLSFMNLVDNIYAKLGIGFITLIPLMLFVYHLVGKYLCRGEKKNV